MLFSPCVALGLFFSVEGATYCNSANRCYLDECPIRPVTCLTQWRNNGINVSSTMKFACSSNFKFDNKTNRLYVEATTCQKYFPECGSSCELWYADTGNNWRYFTCCCEGDMCNQFDVAWDRRYLPSWFRR